MDPITFILIETEARKVSDSPSEDDYKDAIVEIHADIKHLSDDDIDDLFSVFNAYKKEQLMMMGVAQELFDNFFKRKT